MKLDLTEVKWKEFEKYKVSEDEYGGISYDFTNATPEEVMRAYNLAGFDDEIQVVVNN